VIPIWHRYNYYRLQQRIANYWNPPNPAIVHFSATQPYAHVPGPIDQFYDSFWSERSKVYLGRLTIGPSPGGSVTPLFCGVLRTAGRQARIVQIYAGFGQPNVSFARTNSPPRSLALVAVLCELQPARWIASGSRRAGGEDINIASAMLAMNPAFNVSVSNGTINSDPSEVDINILVNGKAVAFKLHVVDLPLPSRPGRVGFASDFSRYWLTADDHFGGSVGIWEWPFTGK
jgi:hypothetical protein